MYDAKELTLSEPVQFLADDCLNNDSMNESEPL